MEDKKVRVCKKCGTEVRTISEPKDIEKTELASDSDWGYMAEDGPAISRVGNGGKPGHWLGQFHCPKCDKSTQNFINETQTEFKKIEGMSREEEIELSRKAKEEVEEQKSDILWEEEKEPGKSW